MTADRAGTPFPPAVPPLKMPAAVSSPDYRPVLDTNIVLDCFVFRDPAMHALVDAMERGRIRPLIHEETLDELRRVLAYPQCKLEQIEQHHVLARYRAVAMEAPMPENFSRAQLALPQGFPKCRDPDDDLFLALAFHARADALITKDRALLKLRRKARKFDVTILGSIDLKELRW